MVYGFACDCGHKAMAEFSMNDPQKRCHCPKCGSWMYRDFSGIAITGDLPSRWSGFDYGLGMDVTDKADRDRKMMAMGLTEFKADAEQQKYRQEMNYVRAHGGGRDKQEAAKRIVELKKESGRKRRQRVMERIRAERRKNRVLT